MKLKIINLTLSVAFLCCAYNLSYAQESIIGSMGQEPRVAPSSVGLAPTPANNVSSVKIGNTVGSGGLGVIDGRPISVVGNRVAPPAWAQGKLTSRTSIVLRPFGSHLFQGHFAGTYSDTASNDYVVSPGDRIVIRIWGARTYNDILVVDQQGNIFLPEIGPVLVGGYKQAQLEECVRSAIEKIYSNSIQCYVNLQSAQPVAVYVTGFVNFPGRYAGGSMDSVLSFIDRAGGINTDRGSYRQISVKRNGRVIAELDLYKFLTEGNVNPIRLCDGDVIVVNEKGNCVSAYGQLREQAIYEFKKSSPSKGCDLIKIATPLPEVSHVSINGIRGNRPFNTYMSLETFRAFTLESGDVVEFIDDNYRKTILTQVTGAIKGASRYPVDRSMKLRDLLAHVEVDSELADLESIYIRRQSVARDQKRVILDALNRLEKSALMATSSTPEEAKIRAEEARLIQEFVQRASKVEPDGVVVVARKGLVSNIWLEEGDEVVIPQKSDVVQITGEVVIPKAVTFDRRLTLDDYLAASGGVSDRADDDHILVAKKNGEVGLATVMGIEPGDRIMVLPKVETKYMLLAKDIMQIIYQIAVATKVINDL